MPCRIGMTTDSKKRKEHWESQYPNLQDWKILGKYDSKTAAQKAEKEFAKQYGCVAHPGGSGNEDDTWYVYKFSY